MLKNNTLIWISALLTVLIFGLIWADYRGLFNPPGQLIRTDTVMVSDTVTLWRDTTIVKEKPVEKKVVEIRRDTVYSKDGDTISLITEQKTYQERLLSDKDTADVEIYVTGIKTSLDSLKMRLRTHKEIVTNTIEITKVIQKKKTFFDRFHIGIQAGYGYAFKSKELTPYVGIGGSFDF